MKSYYESGGCLSLWKPLWFFNMVLRINFFLLQCWIFICQWRPVYFNRNSFTTGLYALWFSNKLLHTVQDGKRKTCFAWNIKVQCWYRAVVCLCWPMVCSLVFYLSTFLVDLSSVHLASITSSSKMLLCLWHHLWCLCFDIKQISYPTSVVLESI